MNTCERIYRKMDELAKENAKAVSREMKLFLKETRAGHNEAAEIHFDNRKQLKAERRGMLMLFNEVTRIFEEQGEKYEFDI